MQLVSIVINSKFVCFFGSRPLILTNTSYCGINSMHFQSKQYFKVSTLMSTIKFFQISCGNMDINIKSSSLQLLVYIFDSKDMRI